MVKFEFVLNDIDACNLIDIIYNEKTRALAQAQQFMSGDTTRVDRANADWYNGHADYLEDLMQKLISGSSSY